MQKKISTGIMLTAIVGGLILSQIALVKGFSPTPNNTPGASHDPNIESQRMDLARRIPFASGRITAVDRAGKRITIHSGFTGAEQTIRVSEKTRIIQQAVVTVAELKVNDKIQLRGVPTGINASMLTAGDRPELPRGAGGPGRRDRSESETEKANSANESESEEGRGFNPPPPESYASATGHITALNPLTVALNEGVSLSVKMAPDARITKFLPVSLESLKAGDHMLVSGQKDEQGNFTATAISVNLDMSSGFGQDGFNRRGFGGPGGFRGIGGDTPDRPGAIRAAN